MSELYSVHIDRVHGGEVSLRVTTVHPDAGPPPASATFPMNLLLDLWGLLDRGFVTLIAGCTLTRDEAKALARDPAYAPRLTAMRCLAFGRDEPCSAADIKELERKLGAGEPTLFRGREIQGWGGTGDQHHVFLPGDPVAFAAALAPLVEAHGVDQREHDDTYAYWRDGDGEADTSDRLPRARVWLVLRDPTLLGFVRAGWRFETASYY